MSTDYNLQELLTTDIRIQIPEDVVSKITSVAPWITVPGAFNVRDISASPSTPTVRPGFIYRSGVLAGISEEGKSILKESLGITTIYDLRKSAERVKSPCPIIEGIETVWLPYGCDPAPVDLKLFAHGDNGVRGYVKMYLDLLDVLEPTYRRVFEHIRDSPEKPFLFHCMGELPGGSAEAGSDVCRRQRSHGCPRRADSSPGGLFLRCYHEGLRSDSDRSGTGSAYANRGAEAEHFQQRGVFDAGERRVVGAV